MKNSLFLIICVLFFYFNSSSQTISQELSEIEKMATYQPEGAYKRMVKLLCGFGEEGFIEYKGENSSPALFKNLQQALSHFDNSDQREQVISTLIRLIKFSSKGKTIYFQRYWHLLYGITGGATSDYLDRSYQADYFFSKGMVNSYYQVLQGEYEDQTHFIEKQFTWLNRYGFLDQFYTLSENKRLMELYEINPDLAAILSQDELLDQLSYETFSDGGKTMYWYQKGEQMLSQDYLKVWYLYDLAFAGGDFTSSRVYSKLLKEVKLDKKFEWIRKECLSDIATRDSWLEDSVGIAERKTLNQSLKKDKRYSSYSQIEIYRAKKSEGTIRLQDIQLYDSTIHNISRRSIKTPRDYFDQGWYNIDLEIIQDYLSYGDKKRAQNRLTDYLSYGDIKPADFSELYFSWEEYISVKLNLADIYKQLGDVSASRREEEKVRSALLAFTQAKEHYIYALDTTVLRRNVELFYPLCQDKSISAQQLSNDLEHIAADRNNAWIRADYFFPMNYSDTTYMTVADLLQSLMNNSDLNIEDTPELGKYQSLYFPMVFGMNQMALLRSLENYYTYLKQQGRLNEYDVFMPFTFKQFDKVVYYKTNLFNHHVFGNRFKLTTLDDKGFYPLFEKELNLLSDACHRNSDTISFMYAYSLAVRSQLLQNRTNSKGLEKTAEEYFQLVKRRGDCSQCYVASALVLATSYLNLPTTENFRKVEKIRQDLLEKSEKGDFLSEDLRKDVYKMFYSSRIIEYAYETESDKKQAILKDLMQIPDRMKKSKTGEDNEIQFFKCWISLQAKDQELKSSVEQIRSIYLESHLKFIENMAFYTEKDRQQYFEEHLNALDLLTYRYYLNGEHIPGFGKMILEHSVFYKSLGLSSRSAIGRFVRESKDPEISHAYSRLVHLESTPDISEQEYYEKYEIERRILSEMYDRRKELSSCPLSFEEIRSSLPANAVVVNIIRTRNPFSLYGDYCAQIVRSDVSIPIFVPLASGEILEGPAFSAYDLFMKDLSGKQKDTSSIIYYWNMLKPHILEGSTVYMINDGVYHKVNLASIKDPQSGKYLSDFYRFHTVSDIKSLGKEAQEMGYIRADLFGNPSFSMGENPVSVAISNLENTEEECNSIQQVLYKNAAFVNSFRGKNATEDRLKQSQNPDILHIASHGFFVPEKTEKKKNDVYVGDVEFRSSTIDFANATDPMIRSGILLSGSANTLSGDDLRKQSGLEEDGVLTAREAMNLRLDSTQLVVLSACETGLGELIPGQGVEGLQRGFKTAGADYLLLSLWSIDDNATRAFMILFYENLVRFGKEKSYIEKAFFTTQKEFRANPKYAHPFYWGAFVLVR